MLGLDSSIAGRATRMVARLVTKLAGRSINLALKARNMGLFHRPVIIRQFDILKLSPQGPCIKSFR